MTKKAFAFAASAMIPIGQASTAGNLTFKSTATIVAKEGISMGAGAGAQKITTDVTGNDTAGMVAGMVASGVTAKGLNGIEAEANKLAKAPKGIDGVTEEAGNLAEDVGKAGKGLEGAAKGAESAAEDAGKVVESGTYSWKIGSAEDAKYLGKGNIGDFSNLEGATIEEVLSRIPEDAVRRELIPEVGKVTEGFEYKWVQDGKTYRVRIHGADASAPAGSNAANGWVIRVQQGKKYLDPISLEFQPPGITNIASPNYSEELANRTHIPIKNPE